MPLDERYAIFAASMMSLVTTFGLTFLVMHAITGVNVLAMIFERPYFVAFLAVVFIVLSIIAAFQKPSEGGTKQ